MKLFEVNSVQDLSINSMIRMSRQYTVNKGTHLLIRLEHFPPSCPVVMRLQRETVLQKVFAQLHVELELLVLFQKPAAAMIHSVKNTLRSDFLRV